MTWDTKTEGKVTINERNFAVVKTVEGQVLTGEFELGKRRFKELDANTGKATGALFYKDPLVSGWFRGGLKGGANSDALADLLANPDTRAVPRNIRWADMAAMLIKKGAKITSPKGSRFTETFPHLKETSSKYTMTLHIPMGEPLEPGRVAQIREWLTELGLIKDPKSKGTVASQGAGKNPATPEWMKSVNWNPSDNTVGEVTINTVTYAVVKSKGDQVLIGQLVQKGKLFNEYDAATGEATGKVFYKPHDSQLWVPKKA